MDRSCGYPFSYDGELTLEHAIFQYKATKYNVGEKLKLN